MLQSGGRAARVTGSSTSRQESLSGRTAPSMWLTPTTTGCRNSAAVGRFSQSGGSAALATATLPARRPSQSTRRGSSTWSTLGTTGCKSSAAVERTSHSGGQAARVTGSSTLAPPAAWPLQETAPSMWPIRSTTGCRDSGLTALLFQSGVQLGPAPDSSMAQGASGSARTGQFTWLTRSTTGCTAMNSPSSRLQTLAPRRGRSHLQGLQSESIRSLQGRQTRQAWRRTPVSS